MDNQTTAPPVVQYTPPPGMFGTKIPSTVAFVIGVLVFLLPFTEIRCGGQKVLTKSGYEYALNKPGKSFMGNIPDNAGATTTTTENKIKAGNTQMIVIIAWGLGVLGLLLSLGNAKAGGAGGLVTGIASAGALIYFMIDAKNNFKDALATQAMDKATEGADDAGLGKMGEAMSNMKLTLAFTPWFYIAVVAFVMAAIFAGMRMRSKGS